MVETERAKTEEEPRAEKQLVPWTADDVKYGIRAEPDLALPDGSKGGTNVYATLSDLTFSEKKPSKPKGNFEAGINMILETLYAGGDFKQVGNVPGTIGESREVTLSYDGETQFSEHGQSTPLEVTLRRTDRPDRPLGGSSLSVRAYLSNVEGTDSQGYEAPFVRVIKDRIGRALREFPGHGGAKVEPQGRSGSYAPRGLLNL